ncbi:hypothetical protein HZS_2089 [Henneguya salminicola]|nr:hypothetical protein HZS_2089 [Henneguya salminicola]
MPLDTRDIPDLSDRCIDDAPSSYGPFAKKISHDILRRLYNEWKVQKVNCCRICLYDMKDQCFVENCYDYCCLFCVKSWLEEFRRCPMCFRYPDKIFCDVFCIHLREWGKTFHHYDYLNRADIDFSPNYELIDVPDEGKVVIYFRIMELPPLTAEDS